MRLSPILLRSWKRRRGKQMSVGCEGDVGKASNDTGQWRPFSYSVGDRLRPPSRTLWTDPDYPSRLNPLRLSPPKKTHFSGQRIPDTVALNCENSPHNGDEAGKRPQNHPPFLIPHTTLPIVTLGKPKERSLGILLNILGLASAPQCPSSPSC